MTTILTVGVAVVDFVMSLDEMPRRAEKYRAKDAAIVGGGNGANAAVAIARLGGKAMLATRLGTDAIGDMIVKDLAAEGVDCSLARRFADCRSSFSSVFIDATGERQIVNFRDLDISFDGGWLERDMPARFDATLADTRWPQGGAVVLRAARERGVPGILDAEAPIREAADALHAASHLAFSAQGLRDWAGHGDLDRALLDVAAETGAWACYTDGDKGAAYVAAGRIMRVPGFAVNVVDTLGAGDVWHGAFAVALAEGQGEPAAMRFAHAAAAIKCTRFGGRSGAPRRDEVESFLRSVA